MLDVLREESNGTVIWLGATESLLEARILIQKDSRSHCSYILLDSRTGEKQIVEKQKGAA
jgi:hypothetical protein